MSSILRKFPNAGEAPAVRRGDGPYIELEDGRRLLDSTAGFTSYAVLGYSHPDVITAMHEQMTRYCHMDYNIWSNPMLEELADLLISRAPAGLNKVYFSGNSGSEALEAALKLSYQVHFDLGRRDKTWLISRAQSFHGATLHGITVSEFPNLMCYEALLPENRAQIAQHHPLYFKRDDENLDDYAHRGAQELEDKILEIGAHRVGAFIGETQLGSLVGDVPPAPNYWKYIREVCDQYDVHLVLDEIYCGLGRSGRVYNCDWDGIAPDFAVVGKNLGAGFAPLGAVVTNSNTEKVIRDGQGRIQHGHTHQGYSLGVAAALAVQKIVQTDTMLEHIAASGETMRTRLMEGLGGHPFFRDLRGRGLMFSLEYLCDDNPGFAAQLTDHMREHHGILINAKWHRVSLTPPYIMSETQGVDIVDALIHSFKHTAQAFELAVE